MTSKLLNLKGLHFLPPPSRPHTKPATQLSADCRGRAKCQKFPRETEEGVFVGFSFFLSFLPGSTGSIKLQYNAPPTTPAGALSHPQSLGLGEGPPLPKSQHLSGGSRGPGCHVLSKRSR